VRDAAQKKTLPDYLQNMLCLTVYESKGLEFDDVIIYNFFSEGEAGSRQWRILEDIEYVKTKEAKLNDELLEMDLLDKENYDDFIKQVKQFENREDDDLETEYEEHTSIQLKENGVLRKYLERFSHL